MSASHDRNENLKLLGTGRVLSEVHDEFFKDSRAFDEIDPEVMPFVWD